MGQNVEISTWKDDENGDECFNFSHLKFWFQALCSGRDVQKKKDE